MSSVKLEEEQLFTWARCTVQNRTVSDIEMDNTVHTDSQDSNLNINCVAERMQMKRVKAGVA